MKTIAKLLSLVMLISMISVPVYAESTLDEKIDLFVENIMAMTSEQKASFNELFELLVALNDGPGMLSVYTNAMNNMSGGQQDKLLAMELLLENLQVLSSDLLDATFTLADFQAAVNANDNGVSLKTEIITRSSVFESALSSITLESLNLGFERINKMFDMQSLAKLLGVSFVLVTTEANGTLYVYEDGLSDILAIAENIPQIDISSEAILIAAIQELADYYNSSSEKALLYSYFLSNGLVKVDSTYSPGTSGGTTPTGTTDSGDATEVIETIVIEDLGDDGLVPEGTALFGDIGRFTWAWTAIRQLYIADVIKGKSETEFDPSGDITRAEFSALLTRLLETSIPTDTPTLEGIFSDVNNNKWYYNEVMAAFKAGYVKGISVTEFDPTANINREQIATILSRVLINSGIEEISVSEIDTVLNEFADADQVSSWAKNGSAMVANIGIIGGVTIDGNQYFNFKDNATRAEVSVMLYRLAQLIETKVVVE